MLCFVVEDNNRIPGGARCSRGPWNRPDRCAQRRQRAWPCRCQDERSLDRWMGAPSGSHYLGTPRPAYARDEPPRGQVSFINQRESPVMDIADITLDRLNWRFGIFDL